MATNHKLKVSDGGASDDAVVRKGPDMVQVKVLAECGIFKNGEPHAKGSMPTISRKAALQFVEAGEVELVEV